MKTNKKNKNFLIWLILIVILFFMGMKCFFSGTSVEYKYWDIFSQGISVVALSPDGKFLAGGNNDGCVILWNTQTHKRIHIFRHNNSVPAEIIFHPSKTWLIIVDHEKSIVIWDYFSYKKIWFADDIGEYGQSSGYTRKALITHNEKQLIVAGAYWENHLYQPWVISIDLESKYIERQFFSFVDHLFYTIGLSPDGTKIAIQSRIFDYMTHEKICDIEHGNGVNGLFFLDSKRIITFADTTNINPHNIIIWNTESGQKIKGYCLHKGRYINNMVKVPDRQLTLSAGEDGTICLWEIETGKVIWSRRVGGMFSHVAVSADGTKGVFTNWFGPVVIDIESIFKRCSYSKDLK
jgi:WD40 repeat protein